MKAWSNDVSINLYQMNKFSVRTRKGKRPGHNFHPPRSRSSLMSGEFLLGPIILSGNFHPAPNLGPPASVQAGQKRQALAGSALKVKSPDSAQLSSLREPGAQDPTSSQAPQMPQREWSVRASQVLRTATHAHCCCHQVTEAGMPERFLVA